jgi:hypothetical protein
LTILLIVLFFLINILLETYAIFPGRGCTASTTATTTRGDLLVSDYATKYTTGDYIIIWIIDLVGINRPTKRGKEKSPSDGHCQCEKQMDNHLLAC